ncbi:MAG: VanZ family protein [Microbacterium sp.]|uniref:VanZ family protein n=1 Tax=Microbacterium sp. TaxID=51671 RepID=UPI001AD0687E|nr:VanZ family protein [Microbacterium sp.]MBN9177802.1 VanZ family protein [Microbacterium sp.]
MTSTARSGPDATGRLPRFLRLRDRARVWARDARAWLVAYGVVVALIGFWPVPVDSGAGPLLRAVTAVFPVATYERIEFGANVLMFVPLGLLLTILLPQSRWLVMPIAFVATVVLESGQAIALSARTPSVLDIIANTAGACLGILVAVFVEVLARSRTAPPEVREEDVEERRSLR